VSPFVAHNGPGMLRSNADKSLNLHLLPKAFCIWHMSGHGNRKVGVTLQIATMIMLLCTPHLPLLARVLAVPAQPGRCAMDHRICRCSPERIASRTCCCFRNMKAAGTSVKLRCHDLRGKPHEQHDLDEDAPPVSPRLRSLPCGQDPQMISHATSEMKYLRSAKAPLPTHRLVPHHISPRGDRYRSPSLEPPVPPPETSIFV
jgi:hypothetical protein